ncbi:MAG: hypothetical protein ABIQ95_00590 [Bdellovibrionia bacterium]
MIKNKFLESKDYDVLWDEWERIHNSIELLASLIDSSSHSETDKAASLILEYLKQEKKKFVRTIKIREDSGWS